MIGQAIEDDEGLRDFFATLEAAKPGILRVAFNNYLKQLAKKEDLDEQEDNHT